jgi:DNA primase catalytic core
MPRYSDGELNELKKQLDLVALIRSRGVELKATGNGSLMGKCPFHEDDKPSFGVTPAKGLWHCLGCGAAGNGIQFVQQFDKISFRHAVELLRSQSAVAFKPTAQTVPKLPPPVALDADDAALLRQVADYYHATLLRSPVALDYVKKRGLTDEAVQAFKLGYADRTLGLRLPLGNRKDGERIRLRLQQLGVYRETGREHLNGSLVVPIADGDGMIRQMYGRKVTPNLRPGTPLHLYLPRPHETLFNPAGLASKEIILGEAILDALAFWCAGYKNVTCAYGVEGFTEEMLKTLVKAGVVMVWLAFDRDKAGDEGAAKVAERLRRHGIECRRVLFPPGMDANEYALKVTPPNKSLGVLLNAAQWLGTAKAEMLPKAEPSPKAESSAQKSDAAASAGAGALLLPSPASAPAPSSLTALAAKVEKPTPAPIAGLPGAPAVELRGDYGYLEIDGREYRLGGLDQLAGSDGLKVALRLRHGERFHLDQLDLCRDADRRRFTERAAEETGLAVELLRRDMGKLLLAVELHQVESARPVETLPGVVLTPEEREEALTWLRAPDLIGRLRLAFKNSGLIGEEANTLLAYLAAVSRKLDRPLAVIIQSASAAGKTALMDAVLAFFPEEEKIKYSAMTGQSLYYLGETSLKHKILAVVEEAGAEKAAYALKLLQSEGELTIASTGKDPATGRLVTQEYHVEGPVSILITTTAIDLDEELLNRCLVLTVDESAEQTLKIHAQQRARRTLAGLAARAERNTVLRVLRNAQRLLRPLAVVNPFAPFLSFPHGRTRARRDHEKYLTLIDAITLLHQHQRPVRAALHDGQAVDYIEATREDVALANELAPVALGRSLDELPPQTRRLLEHARALVEAKHEKKMEPYFSRRELREACGWSLTQTRLHLDRLVEYEYLALRHGRFGASFLYELCDEADATAHTYDVGVAAFNAGVAGGGPSGPPPFNAPKGNAL